MVERVLRKGGHEMAVTETRITVRKGISEDVVAMSRTLGRAFFEDPIMRWAIPNDARRETVLPDFFELFAKIFESHDESYITEDGAGAALWVPPGKQPIGEDQAEEFAERMEELAGVDAERLFEVSKIIDDHHPQGSFYFLQFMGVEPGRQGHGIGSALMAPVLERCDREGMPAYLDATSERNRKLYERHGFEAGADYAPLGCPPLYPMWRQPGSGRHATAPGES
jgi:GNAT superfamily N-acetyltransferase